LKNQRETTYKAVLQQPVSPAIHQDRNGMCTGMTRAGASVGAPAFFMPRVNPHEQKQDSTCHLTYTPASINIEQFREENIGADCK